MHKIITRQVSIAALALLCAATAFAGGGRKNDRPDSTEQRVTALTINGQVATLKLADGTSLQLPASIIRVGGGQSDVAEDKASDGTGNKKSRRMSLQQVAAKSDGGDLAGVVRVKYDKSGYARRAKLQLFSNASEASAYIERAARQRAEINAAAKPNH